MWAVVVFERWTLPAGLKRRSLAGTKRGGRFIKVAIIGRWLLVQVRYR